VQYNSTPDNNLLVDGFLAKQLRDEIPTAPGTRVYVTEEVTDVTSNVLAGVTASTSGIDRYNMIEANRKSLIANCESSGNHRCGVSSFHQGLEYFLIKRLEVRDVRLVYAPATSIGKYGGDIDNWQWPRHTGDFGTDFALWFIEKVLRAEPYLQTTHRKYNQYHFLSRKSDEYSLLILVLRRSQKKQSDWTVFAPPE
jgi:hypothetical protein